MKSVLLGKHTKNCYGKKLAMSGEWNNAWSEACPDTIFRSGNSPKKYGSRIWLVFSCNDPDCNARLAVRADTIEFPKW